MSVSRQWRYKIFLGLMILYMATACIVACAFLWNMTVTHYSLEENTADNSENPSLVPICAVKKDIESDPYLNCSLLDTLSYEKFVANGWTKIVYRAKLDNSPQQIAIKVVNLKGKDVTDCAKSEPLLMCHNKAVDKLVREINFLKALNHDTIIKLKYYCSKTLENNSCMKYAVIATEIGEPITNLKLLQMTWKERKKIIIDLVELLDYAHKSPLGVLGLLDLRRQQFVLANGHMKLADLDDVVIDDPPCITDTDCLNLNITINCISRRCTGYNSHLNVQKSFQEFGPYIFLREGVPAETRLNLDRLRQLWQNNMSPEQLRQAALLL